jgi:hypothetical protein
MERHSNWRHPVNILLSAERRLEINALFSDGVDGWLLRGAFAGRPVAEVRDSRDGTQISYVARGMGSDPGLYPWMELRCAQLARKGSFLFGRYSVVTFDWPGMAFRPGSFSNTMQSFGEDVEGRCRSGGANNVI